MRNKRLVCWIGPLIFLSLPACSKYGEEPEIKKLKDRDFDISEEDKKEMLEMIQEKLLNGEESPLVYKLLKALKISSEVTHKKQTLKIGGTPVTSTGTAGSALELLKTKYATYKTLSASAVDEYGFVPGCDGLLFTSLLRAGGGTVDIFQAESQDDPGKWFRNGAQDCYEKKESKSTISRDMFRGLVYALWELDDLKAVNRWVEYGKDHKWIVGEAINEDELYGRAYVTPTLAGDFFNLAFHMGGGDHPARKIPSIPSDKPPKGFEAHLQILSIFFRGLLEQGVTDTDFLILKLHAAREPKNAFYVAAFAAFDDGNMSTAADLLLETAHFPTSSLPTSAQHCEEYLWQRDADDSGWDPCTSENETHTGADFIFTTALVLDQLRND